MQREVEGNRGGRDAFVQSETVGTDHSRQHRPGTRHVLQAVNLDLQVVGLHDGGRIGLYHVHTLVIRNHFPFVAGHHQVIRFVDDGVLFAGTSQETLPDGGSHLVGVCLDGFERPVIANQGGFGVEIVDQHLVGSRAHADVALQATYSLVVIRDVGNIRFRRDFFACRVVEQHSHHLGFDGRHRYFFVIYVARDVHDGFNVHGDAQCRVVGRVFQRTAVTTDEQ